MNKKDNQYKKLNISTKRVTLTDYPLKDTPHSHFTSDNLTDHYRLTLQQLQQNKLSHDLQIQKRSLLQQQLKQLKNQTQDLKAQIQSLKSQNLKLSKKYFKLKQKKQCQKSRQHHTTTSLLQKQRQIYLNDRHLLQTEINDLKNKLQNQDKLQQNHKLQLLTQSLKKQLNGGYRKIQQQNKIIQFMNQKLSSFQKQNSQIMKNVELLENKLSEIQIETLLSKKKKECNICKVKGGKEEKDNGLLKKRKRVGSIKNMKRDNKECQDSDQLQSFQI